MFKIEAKQDVFLVTVSGFIKEDEAKEFIMDYGKKIKLVNPPATNLILDGRKLSVSSQNMLPVLEGCLSMYIKDRFKKIYLTKFDSPITMMQIKKLGTDSGFMDKIAIIDSPEHALEQIKREK